MKSQKYFSLDLEGINKTEQEARAHFGAVRFAVSLPFVLELETMSNKEKK